MNDFDCDFDCAVCNCWKFRSMEMRREDLRAKLEQKLSVSPENDVFVAHFEELMKQFMQKTSDYQGDLARHGHTQNIKTRNNENIMEELINAEQQRRVNNWDEDHSSSSEPQHHQQQEAPQQSQYNNYDLSERIEAHDEYQQARIDEDTIKIPDIMYENGTLYATEGIKSYRCVIYDWCYEHVLLLVFLLFVFQWIIRWFYRRRKNEQRRKQSIQIKNEILLFLKQRRNHDPPYVSIDQAKVHCVPFRFNQFVWQMAKELVENDPNVQKSTRVVDGVQRDCWKISQTAFLND